MTGAPENPKGYAPPMVSVGEGWRVSRSVYSPTSSRMPSRFVPASVEELGVLYLADSRATALAEFVQGQRQVPLIARQGRVLSRISFEPAVDLVDLTSPETLLRLGLDNR